MLSDRRPILLTNARIIDPSRDLDFVGRSADRRRRDPRNQARHRRGRRAGGHRGHRLPAAGCVAPGLIDMRAFIGEPGAEYRETLATASQAAAAGGVTTIICQPDTSPAIDDPAIVDFILRRARDTAIVHVHADGGAYQGPRRQRDDRDRPSEGRRRRRLHRRRDAASPTRR